MIDYKQRYTLSPHWIIRYEPNLYPPYLAYNIFLDKRVILSRSLYHLLNIFKYNYLSLSELIEFIDEKYDFNTLSQILFNNVSLPQILDSKFNVPKSKYKGKAIFNPYNISLANMPLEAEIHFTERCNLICRHCVYSCNNISERDEIDYKSWMKLFDQLEEADVLKVIISGDEPFFMEA